MKFWSILVLFMITLEAVGQQPGDGSLKNKVIYDTGLNGLAHALAGNVKYPPDDRRRGKCGTVLLKFKISPDQKVDSIVVVSSVTPAMDAEAVRVLSLTSGHWTIAGGGTFLWPLTFTLEPPDDILDLYDRRNADRYLKTKNYKKAKPYLEELKRRRPLEVSVLDDLIDVYAELGDAQKREQMEKFRAMVIEFKQSDRVIMGY